MEGRRGGGRINRPGSHFDEIGFNGGSSTASWMLDIRSMLESRSPNSSTVHSAIGPSRKREKKDYKSFKTLEEWGIYKVKVVASFLFFLGFFCFFFFCFFLVCPTRASRPP